MWKVSCFYKEVYVVLLYYSGSKRIILHTTHTSWVTAIHKPMVTILRYLQLLEQVIISIYTSIIGKLFMNNWHHDIRDFTAVSQVSDHLIFLMSNLLC